jgi:hypothetical protein
LDYFSPFAKIGLKNFLNIEKKILKMATIGLLSLLILYFMLNLFVGFHVAIFTCIIFLFFILSVSIRFLLIRNSELSQSKAELLHKSTEFNNLEEAYTSLEDKITYYEHYNIRLERVLNHDVNSQLNFLNYLLEDMLLSNDTFIDSSPSGKAFVCKEILKEIHQLRENLNGFIFYHQLYVHRVHKAYESLDLNSVVEKVVQERVRVAKVFETRFSCHYENLPLLNFDYQKVFSIVKILIDDFVFTTPSKFVYVKTFVSNNDCYLTIGNIQEFSPFNENKLELKQVSNDDLIFPKEGFIAGLSFAAYLVVQDLNLKLEEFSNSDKKVFILTIKNN